MLPILVAGAPDKPLAIDADTLACEWDGSPVDHGAVIEPLDVGTGLEENDFVFPLSK